MKPLAKKRQNAKSAAVNTENSVNTPAELRLVTKKLFVRMAEKNTVILTRQITQAKNLFIPPTTTARITKYISAVTLLLSKTKNVRAGQLRVSQRQRVKIAVPNTVTWERTTTRKSAKTQNRTGKNVLCVILATKTA